MKVSFEKLLLAVQEDRNSPLLKDLIDQLVRHGINYAANKYNRRLDEGTVYDLVIDSYMSGKFNGSFANLRSYIRKRVDHLATQEEDQLVVGLEVCVNIACPNDIDMFELKELIGTILSDMSPQERKILQLCFEDLKTFEEIANQLGLSAEQVRKIRNRAICALRKPKKAKLVKAWYDAI